MVGTMDLNSLFETTVDKLVGNQLTEAFKEYNVNIERPSITSLPFSPLPYEMSEKIRDTKVGLFDVFSAGRKKQLVKSIEEKKTTCAEVLLIAREHRLVESNEDHEFDTYMYFYKVADLNGTVMREDVPAISDDYVVTLEYNNGNSASVTGCADKVNPKDYMHMFLLNYYLKDEPYYALLTKEQFEDLHLLIKEAGSRWHYAEDGVGYKW